MAPDSRLNQSEIAQLCSISHSSLLLRRQNLDQRNAVYAGAGLGVNWAGRQQWNTRAYIAKPALIDGSTCTHLTHRLFTRFSTGLPTATPGKPVAKRQLSLLIPGLSSAYPQAYAQTYPQCSDKRRCAAGGGR